MLRSMVDRYSNGVGEEGRDGRRPEMVPDRRLFTAVMDGWAKCGQSCRGMERAQGLLRLMEELYEEHDVEGLRPDMIT